MRHKNQKTGYFSRLLDRSRGKAIVDTSLRQVAASRPLSPPHAHVFKFGCCSVCGVKAPRIIGE